MYPERHEERVCVDCDEPIDPGQLYVVDGPLHVYCGELRLRPFADHEISRSAVESGWVTP